MQSSAGLADWCVVVDLVQLLPLLPSASHSSVRAYMARVTALSAFALGSSHMESVEAILRPDNSLLDTSASVQKELTKLLTDAFLAAFPIAKYACRTFDRRPASLFIDDHRYPAAVVAFTVAAAAAAAVSAVVAFTVTVAVAVVVCIGAVVHVLSRSADRFANT